MAIAFLDDFLQHNPWGCLLCFSLLSILSYFYRFPNSHSVPLNLTLFCSIITIGAAMALRNLASNFLFLLAPC